MSDKHSLPNKPTPDPFDDYYTIEFYGTKGWEVLQTHTHTIGILKATQLFANIVVNDRDDLQWRLTTPTI